MTGSWPGNGTKLVTGGTARYRLYPTADGGMIAAAPIEDRFWMLFCEAIRLDPALRDDMRDSAATIASVAARIGAETVVAPSHSVWRLPDSMGFETAASMGLAYQTAWSVSPRCGGACSRCSKQARSTPSFMRDTGCRKRRRHCSV